MACSTIAFARLMSWKRVVPMDAPPFISPQNVSSSVPVMPQSYPAQGFVTSPAESNLSAPDTRA